MENLWFLCKSSIISTGEKCVGSKHCWRLKCLHLIRVFMTESHRRIHAAISAKENHYTELLLSCSTEAQQHLTMITNYLTVAQHLRKHTCFKLLSKSVTWWNISNVSRQLLQSSVSSHCKSAFSCMCYRPLNNKVSTRHISINCRYTA